MDLLLLLVEWRGQLLPRSVIIERLWGQDVFIEVETGINTAVSKVRHALRDAADAPRYIETVPGRGYRFIAPVEVASAADGTEAPRPVGTRSRAGDQKDAPRGLAAAASRVLGSRLEWLVSALVILAVAGTAAWGLRASRPPGPPLEVVPLTTLSGLERGVTFSPDSRQIAFTWSGEDRHDWNIHVQLVGSADMRQLTSGPARDLAPQWSPDGRTIAFLRIEPDQRAERLRLVSSLSGVDRELSDVPVLPALSWSPDGRFIAAGRAVDPGAAVPGGIDLIPVHGGEPRRLTQPDAPGFDWMAAFAPDGRRLAYVSCLDSLQRSHCHVQLVDLDASYNAVGPPRRLTTSAVWTVWGLTWSRDGSSIIYSVLHGALSYLWRVDPEGNRPPERIEIAGINALFPATARSTDRLAFTRLVSDQDVYRMNAGSPAEAVARSSVFDGQAQFSLDGRRIAFCSNRSGGAMEVWVAEADGSRPAQLTHGPGLWQCSPSWSPDGRTIAFESLTGDGHWGIWTVGVDAGTPRAVAPGSGDRNMPAWSHDGAWIYFSWSDAKGRDIWRVRPRDGVQERVTTRGSGMAALETPDGRFLLYQAGTESHPHEPTDAPLLGQPLGGGTPRTLIPCVRGTAFSVQRSGIYYVRCRDASESTAAARVHVRDIETGEDRFIGMLEQYENHMPSGFAVSPDGRTILFSRHVSSGEDLMMIENFR